MGWNYRETTGNEVGVGIGWIEKSGALDLGFSKHFYGEYAWLWSAGLRFTERKATQNSAAQAAE